MKNLYRQEMFKLLKRRGTWWGLGFLVLQNIGFAWLGVVYHTHTLAKEFWVAGFASPAFIVFMMIAACAGSISSEFEYNTMKNVITQAYSRSAVLVSKWLAMLTYSLMLYGLVGGLTFANHIVWPDYRFALTATLPGSQQALWQDWLTATSANFVTLWLLLSVVFLVAAMLKKGLVATLCGIVGYFALGVISRLMFQLIDKWEPLKWNPINFLNYSVQVTMPLLTKLTHLTNTQMFWGNLGYIGLFMLLGLYFFSQKEV
ncbi:ABC transporter permease [Levilactobacillus acidifarinae]|nr:ABC transporter permease subunit [Levilactobacillus acidifarinae]GEO68793.1 ABC transporter permease [Levilactobacillus acidifarinae]